MRRASLSAFIGIVQADDDGNTASNKVVESVKSISKPVVKSIDI